MGIPLEVQPKHYSTSGNKYLKNVLKHLNISADKNIVDIGSGKGGALIEMAKFPFNKIVGIEYSEMLCNIAKKNISKLGLKNVFIINSDASIFLNFQEFDYIYMYNPFGPKTMSIVLKNISTSWLKNKKETFIIYKNPELHELIIKTNIFHKISEFETETTHKFFVYKSFA